MACKNKCDLHILYMRFVYACNIIVAGVVGAMSAFAPNYAADALFGGPNSLGINMTGCHWIAITVLSGFGLIWPERFCVVFLHQLIYKGLYLISAIIPALANKSLNARGQIGLSVFFLVWIIVLPFAIPWKQLFKCENSSKKSIEVMPIDQKQQLSNGQTD